MASYDDKGEYDRAIADYDKAIELKPNNPVAYNNRGNAYSSKREYDRAIADYSKAIELDPKLAAASYNGRGGAYADQEDYNSALPDLNKAIELDPKYAFAYYNRGKTYEALARRDEAIADFRRVLAEIPDAENPYHQKSNAALERLNASP